VSHRCRGGPAEDRDPPPPGAAARSARAPAARRRRRRRRAPPPSTRPRRCRRCCAPRRRQRCRPPHRRSARTARARPPEAASVADARDNCQPLCGAGRWASLGRATFLDKGRAARALHSRPLAESVYQCLSVAVGLSRAHLSYRVQRPPQRSTGAHCQLSIATLNIRRQAPALQGSSAAPAAIAHACAARTVIKVSVLARTSASNSAALACAPAGALPPPPPGCALREPRPNAAARLLVICLLHAGLTWQPHSRSLCLSTIQAWYHPAAEATAWPAHSAIPNTCGQRAEGHSAAAAPHLCLQLGAHPLTVVGHEAPRALLLHLGLGRDLPRGKAVSRLLAATVYCECLFWFRTLPPSAVKHVGSHWRARPLRQWALRSAPRRLRPSPAAPACAATRNLRPLAQAARQWYSCSRLQHSSVPRHADEVVDVEVHVREHVILRLIRLHPPARVGAGMHHMVEVCGSGSLQAPLQCNSQASAVLQAGPLPMYRLSQLLWSSASSAGAVIDSTISGYRRLSLRTAPKCNQSVEEAATGPVPHERIASADAPGKQAWNSHCVPCA